MFACLIELTPDDNGSFLVTCPALSGQSPAIAGKAVSASLARRTLDEADGQGPRFSVMLRSYQAYA
jgi:hypothetical protein